MRRGKQWGGVEVVNISDTCEFHILPVKNLINEWRPSELKKKKKKLSENTGIRIKCSRNMNEFVAAKVGSNFCSKEDEGA